MNLFRAALLLSSCGALWAADGGGKLTIYMAGKPVASETYTLKDVDGKMVLDGSGTAHIGPMLVSIEQYKVVTDDKYQPLEAVFKGKMGTMSMDLKTVFADGKAKNEITTAQGTQHKEDDVSAGGLVISQNLPVFPLSILAKRVSFASDAPQEFKAYVLGQAELAVTAQYKGKDTVEFAGQKVDLDHIAGSAAMPQGQTLNFDLWVLGDRTLVKLAVPAQKVEAYQDGYEPKPAPPPPPSPAPADKAETPKKP